MEHLQFSLLNLGLERQDEYFFLGLFVCKLAPEDTRDQNEHDSDSSHRSADVLLHCSLHRCLATQIRDPRSETALGSLNPALGHTLKNCTMSGSFFPNRELGSGSGETPVPWGDWSVFDAERRSPCAQKR